MPSLPLVSKLTRQTSAVDLNTSIPGNIIKRTFRVQRILLKRAIVKTALDELAPGKSRASKNAPDKLNFYKNCLVE